MDEEMNKAKLLEILRTTRAEWDSALTAIPKELLSKPNTLDAWAIKDHITHLTNYEGWFADRIDEALHGIVYHPVAMDAMPFEERNKVVYEMHRNDPLDEVLAKSKAAHEKLLKGVEAQSDDFLLKPQMFEGVPHPMIIWEMLRGDVYGHYAEHIDWIKNWWAEQEGKPAPSGYKHQNMS
jgi:Protein of unknown function (DUF1706)